MDVDDEPDVESSTSSSYAIPMDVDEAPPMAVRYSRLEEEWSSGVVERFIEIVSSPEKRVVIHNLIYRLLRRRLGTAFHLHSLLTSWATKRLSRTLSTSSRSTPTERGTTSPNRLENAMLDRRLAIRIPWRFIVRHLFDFNTEHSAIFRIPHLLQR